MKCVYYIHIGLARGAEPCEGEDGSGNEGGGNSPKTQSQSSETNAAAASATPIPLGWPKVCVLLHYSLSSVSNFYHNPPPPPALILLPIPPCFVTTFTGKGDCDQTDPNSLCIQE